MHAPAIACVALAALFPVLSALAGCRSCRNEHPYVPYAVGDASSAAAPDASAAPPTAADAGPAASSTAEPSLIAPPGATTWKVEDLELRAPEGREILLAIVRDFDGDGKKDALYLVRPPAFPGKPYDVGPAELVAMRAGDVPRTLATAPPPRVDPACTPIARLERVGPRSVFAEVGTSCTVGKAERAAWVVRLATEPAVAFDLAIVDPAGAPKLTIDADGADRDGDGLDDVTLRTTIEGGFPPFEPGPRLTAKLAFFDRSAGASRDSDEPEASFRALAAQASARAGKVREAPLVPVLVQQMRALYRAMCREGGAPRLLRRGEGIPCGAGRPLEDAGVAEVRALVAQGDAIRAIAAAERATSPPATKTPARVAEIAQLLAQVAPLAKPRSVRILAVLAPAARGPHPEWGPLAFTAEGKLLVRTASKVLRVDPESGEAQDTDLPAWSSLVVSPDGATRWLEAYHACEGVSLRATFVPTGGDGEGDVRDVLLPIAPPLGSRCSGARGGPAASLPLAWSSRGLEAIVSGQLVLVPPGASAGTLLASPLDATPAPGSPRSPSGKAFGLVTPQGVLVRGASSVRVKAPELEPYEDLRQCTVSDDATRLACATAHGKVVALMLDRN